MDELLKQFLQKKFYIDPDAEFDVGDNWYGVVEEFYRAASVLLGDASLMRTRAVKETEGRLLIDVDVPADHRADIDVLIEQAADRVVHTGSIAAVLAAWQRGEISGHVAKRLTRCRSYGYLYRRARENDVVILFKPGDIARRVKDGSLTSAEAQDILGIEDPDEMPAFVSAWTWTRPT